LMQQTGTGRLEDAFVKIVEEAAYEE